MPAGEEDKNMISPQSSSKSLSVSESQSKSQSETHRENTLGSGIWRIRYAAALAAKRAHTNEPSNAQAGERRRLVRLFPPASWSPSWQ